MKKVLYIFLYFLFLNSFAGIDEKVSKWFNDNNFKNRTNPSVYKAQGANYLSGGSYSERNEVVDSINFVDIQTPKISAGCGGIDMYMGGFKAANTEEFIKMLRAIGQNSKTLAFMLALKVVTPMIENEINDIQNIANKYLKMNVDSCQFAQKLVGGSLEYMGKRNANCIVSALSDGRAESWDEASQQCGAEGKTNQIEGDNPNKTGFIKGNLAWQILMEDPFFKNDLDFAELVMNITGTVIIDGSDQVKFREIPSAIKEQFTTNRFYNIYNTFLKGGRTSSREKLKIYKCIDRSSSKKGCSRISNFPESVKVGFVGLEFRIRKILKSINQKIYKDEKLNDVEIGLISSTEIPIYKFMVTSAAAIPNSIITSNGGSYARLIAEEILLKSLSQIISKVHMLSLNTPGIKGSQEVLNFKKDTEMILSGLEKRKDTIRLSAERKMDLFFKIKSYEKLIVSRMSSRIISNLNWSSL